MSIIHHQKKWWSSSRGHDWAMLPRWLGCQYIYGVGKKVKLMFNNDPRRRGSWSSQRRVLQVSRLRRNGGGYNNDTHFSSLSTVQTIKIHSSKKGKKKCSLEEQKVMNDNDDSPMAHWPIDPWSRHRRRHHHHRSKQCKHNHGNHGRRTEQDPFLDWYIYKLDFCLFPPPFCLKSKIMTMFEVQRWRISLTTTATNSNSSSGGRSSKGKWKTHWMLQWFSSHRHQGENAADLVV